MSVPQESLVGITSNPDARLANDSSTLVTPANWADLQARDITINPAGRKPTVATRSNNAFSPQGVS